LIVAFPTALLGVMISNVRNSNAVRWVILALLFELLILLFLSGQMILE
jgi:predicted branched-subunit amino acid permease